MKNLLKWNSNENGTLKKLTASFSKFEAFYEGRKWNGMESETKETKFASKNFFLKRIEGSLRTTWKLSF